MVTPNWNVVDNIYTGVFVEIPQVTVNLRESDPLVSSVSRFMLVILTSAEGNGYSRKIAISDSL